ncbi:hypothetical protein CC_3547 [Caulobacter vibrioides CB15]|uniref:Uncharacterized protein n=1 Tax=Caulobacter vibrioides (strain ATCC 19089 / CIP 103742 / CB 15) TaxID=190650 RepID=Q9A2L4_CAUVC|nr:hypothetical protein CC_3547 [Caulobacter vibrioides CB15]ATC30358.1 hypothetical protein CA607_19050 [Caulobacter vibrioides]
MDRRAGHGCRRSSWSAPVRGLLGSRAERRSRPPSSRARTTWRSGQSSRNANTHSRSPGSPGRSVASPAPSAVRPREADLTCPHLACFAGRPPPEGAEGTREPSSPSGGGARSAEGVRDQERNPATTRRLSDSPSRPNLLVSERLSEALRWRVRRSSCR